jgi:hypothetical protein
LCEREREKRHTQKKRYTNTHIEIYKPRNRDTNTEEDRYEQRQRDRDTERKHLNGYR